MLCFLTSAASARNLSGDMTAVHAQGGGYLLKHSEVPARLGRQLKLS